MPRCPCLAHQRLYAERRFRRREAVSGLLARLRLHRLQGWWDAGTGWWDAGDLSGSTLPPLGSDERPYDRGREES